MLSIPTFLNANVTYPKFGVTIQVAQNQDGNIMDKIFDVLIVLIILYCVFGAIYEAVRLWRRK